jgi:hypothetical protein
MAKQTLGQTLRTDVVLTQAQQQQIRTLWNKRVKDDLAFIPHNERSRTTKAEARFQNKAYGNFAAHCLKDVMAEASKRECVERAYANKKVVAVGWGRGYDSNWFLEAARAGLQVVWLDVSDVATTKAWRQIRKQVREAKRLGIEVPSSPNVKRAEFYTALMEPETIGLDLSEVAVWFISRTLGCMYNHTRDLSLEAIGKASLSDAGDPDKRNRVVIVNAFVEDNPGHKSSTSTIMRLGTVRQRLRKGAGRPITIKTWGYYRYFAQTYRAVVVQSK